jgi:hypothetical protein
METKNPFLSKRIWGMIIIALCQTVEKLAPFYPPLAALIPVTSIAEHAGQALLVAGMLVAEQPLINAK